MPDHYALPYLFIWVVKQRRLSVGQPDLVWGGHPPLILEAQQSIQIAVTLLLPFLLSLALPFCAVGG